MSSLGYNIWWKRYLTLLQIFQFVITIFFNLYWGYSYYQGHQCAGTLTGFYTGIFIIFSFLVLFVQFYAQNYKSGRSEISPRTSPRSPRKPKKDDEKI